DAAELHRRTGGNPFFVAEVLGSREGAVPVTVRDAVLARAARLSEPARRALHAAVVLGPRSSAEVILDCASADASSLDACEEAGLLLRAGSVLEFRHELVREALRSTLPASELRSWHAAALGVLRSRGGSSFAVMAHHAEGAEEPEAALEYAIAAAREAAALRSHKEAVAQYTRAIHFADSSPADTRAELFEGRAFECYLIGRYDEAMHCRKVALGLREEEPNPRMVGDNLRWISRMAWVKGRKDEADHYARKAIEVLDPLPPGRELGMARGNLSALCMLEGSNDDAIRHGEAAIALARALGDREIEAYALNSVGASRARILRNGDWRELEESLRIALEAGLEEHASRAYTNLMAGALYLGDLALAERWMREGLGYTTEHDLEEWRLYLISWRAFIELRRGRWDLALEVGAEIIRNTDVSPISRIQALVAAGLIHARRGSPGASALLDEALSLAIPSGEMQRIGPVRVARAEAAWLAGDAGRAAEELGSCDAEARARCNAWLLGEIAFWEGLVKPPVEAPPEAPTGAATPWTTLLSGDAREAARRFQELGHPYEVALALSTSGDPEVLREAHEGLLRLGAKPAAAIVAKRLRALGVRDLPRAPRASTLANQAGLTARELEVLSLIAKGMRNADIAGALFVSTKTVDHHVSSILGKIGARTRTEAAAWLSAQAEPGP
ncbi:MAG TPA: LuxR C-terminal-related transcriptional regulator, partial [Holophagaceae bacterium]|nr:LuxR C-terminal-related transcriptional regulator [Holophagaceae bacterium]